ncbi:ABC transporter substrate-binding protein [Azospirillum himalayense]|uniref:ABC transporter substrate-binding protein n=1 Tax=Azospirillum himalayense TaxID=654847 RepID=UPI003A93EDBE
MKIGILQPVTGALAHDGDLGRLGAEMAINEINAAGGIKGLGGAKIEMVFGDARSTPEAGTQEVERMQAEGVCAIVGGFASPICLAASQAAARNDLPYLVDVGVSDQIMARGLTNPESDGLNHANNPISTATIPPVEILEAAYPVMFTHGRCARIPPGPACTAAGWARSTRSRR